MLPGLEVTCEKEQRGKGRMRGEEKGRAVREKGEKGEKDVYANA